MSRDEYMVGFDLGGTKMVSAVFDSRFKSAGRSKRKTNAHEGGDAVFKRIIAAIRDSLEKAALDVRQVSTIGISSPGPLDNEGGVILETPNLGFKHFPIAPKLEEVFEVPVFLENDVNAGVYGEYRRGAAAGFKNIVGIFPGTGVGGGLIINGKLFRGATGNAGEIGHMIIQAGGPLCGCGQHGCLEAVASRTAMAKDAVALASAGGSPLLSREAGTDFKQYRSGVFAKAVALGEEAVVRIVERAAWFLGIAMANCVNLLSPEVIVLGGGLVEKLGSSYIQQAESSMRSHLMPVLSEKVRVVRAELGDEAVVIGSALLAAERLREKD